MLEGLKGRELLKGLLSVLSLLLSLLELSASSLFLFLGGQYPLAMYGSLDMPRLYQIGWFIDELFGVCMSAGAIQALVWIMTILGGSLIITNIDCLRVGFNEIARTEEKVNSDLSRALAYINHKLVFPTGPLGENIS